jgi:hypothetical protein
MAIAARLQAAANGGRLDCTSRTLRQNMAATCHSLIASRNEVDVTAFLLDRWA